MRNAALSALVEIARRLRTSQSDVHKRLVQRIDDIIDARLRTEKLEVAKVALLQRDKIEAFVDAADAKWTLRLEGQEKTHAKQDETNAKQDETNAMLAQQQQQLAEALALLKERDHGKASSPKKRFSLPVVTKSMVVLGQVKGAGGAGIVYAAKLGAMSVACKMFKGDPSSETAMRRELLALARLRHHSFVSVVAAVYDDNDPNGEAAPLGYVMEMMDCDLQTRLSDPRFKVQLPFFCATVVLLCCCSQK